MVFAIGMRRAGLPGAIVASACFTLPSAILIILFGYGISALGDLNQSGWLHGLKLAAVAVVAQAVWGMGRKFCPDVARLALGLGTATMILVYPGSLSQIAAIAIGAIIGWWLYRGEFSSQREAAKLNFCAHAIAAACLTSFFGLLFVLPIVAAAAYSMRLNVFAAFYRAGSLVFGGGHVVLPRSTPP